MKPYYEYYRKYKNKYINLKNKIGGQVIIDPEQDDVLRDNALEEIVIKVINTFGDELKYKKVIRVKAGDEKGYVTTNDYETGNANRHYVNRGEIEKLLKDINKVWDVPNPKNNDFISSQYILSIEHGDKKWPNGDPERRTSRLTKSDDPDEIYETAVTNVLSFE